MEKIEMLHELCDTLTDELEEVNDKIRKANGDMSAGELEMIDKLAHALKSIKTTVAMMESEGYSNRSMPRYERSYKRDSMGRYSRDGGYSYADEMHGVMNDLRSLMADMPAEKQRKVRRFLDEME